MRRVIFSLFVLFVLLVNCNKGISPTEVENFPHSDLTFPIEIIGGDLSGNWLPQVDNPLEACLVDPDQLEGLVDSLILETSLSGSLSFNSDQTFTFYSFVIEITPTIITGPMTIPMPPFVEVLDTTAVYEQPWSNAIIMPLETQIFKIDTVGYSVNQDSLTLVTLPTGFPMFSTMEYYLIFRLIKSVHQP